MAVADLESPPLGSTAHVAAAVLFVDGVELHPLGWVYST
jgi:hypothetical protein